ncbi:MAG: hypothetical protein K0R03_2509 [Moraxellaceae bacterium]|nr:hypothetical protein [Moraxellaceae bacterium]
MIISRILLALVLVASAASATAAALRIVEGEADVQGYEQALAKQGQWFQRAINVCVEREYCEKPVVMQMKVDTDGRARDCQLVNSDIKDAQTAGLFCSIIRNTAFPPGNAPVTAEFALTVQVVGKDGRERCPAELGSRRDTPGLVRQCLNHFLDVINSERSSEAHQYGARLEDMTGRMQVKISIAPSGKVRDVDVVHTDIKAWNFRRGIVRLIEIIDFGPADRRETHEVVFRVPFEGIEGS